MSDAAGLRLYSYNHESKRREEYDSARTTASFVFINLCLGWNL
jgi:hypothetical protein